MSASSSRRGRSCSARRRPLTAIECALQLKAEEKFDAREMEHIDIETFDVAYNIIGGGEEGDRTSVSTKEEADHSLPYLVSVALLDAQVMPEQYAAERILRPDVQKLLHRVSVHPVDAFSDRFPSEMPCRLTIAFRDNGVLSKETHDYPGFITRPMSWEMACEKFERVTERFTTASMRRSISDAVRNLESIQVREFARLLHDIETPERQRR